MKMEKQIIFGVYEKNGYTSGSYTGFFKHEQDAKKELKSQMNRVKEEFGLDDLILREDRVVKQTDRVEEIFFIIYPIVLR